MNDDLVNTQEDLERARAFFIGYFGNGADARGRYRAGVETLAKLIASVRAEAQQEMRDRGFQHPDDVAAMILSTDKRAREQSAARLAAAEKLAQALREIRDDDTQCDCDHTNENCCARVDEYCPYCIAALALAEWEAAGK